LTFNTSGISTVPSSDLTLKYTLQELTSSGFSTALEPALVTGWDPSGIDTTLEIPLNTTENDFKTAINEESVYLITFSLYSNDTKIFTDGSKDIKHIIITSALFNYIDASNFETVHLDKWLANYDQCVKNNSIQLTKSTAASDVSGTVSFSNTGYYDT